jgi:hypothetical protein
VPGVKITYQEGMSQRQQSIILELLNADEERGWVLGMASDVWNI